MRITKRQYLALSAVAVIGGVFACGPEFSWQLLDDRTATLRSTPTNDFSDQLPGILPHPADKLKARESSDVAGLPTDEEAAEFKGDDRGVAELVAMRRAKGGDAAYAVGADLPPAVRLYTAGAVAFDWQDMPQAANRFQAVLDLPEAQRKSRATWAAFMLGRIHAAAGEEEAAAKYFAMTRDLAVHGAPDPLGLAVASYDEEAGMHYRMAEALLKDGKLPSDQAENFGRHMTAAGKLFGEAQARGSGWSFNSLILVAGEVMAEPLRVEPSAHDPFMQHLLVAYTLARVSDDPKDQHDYTFQPYIDGHRPMDVASGKSNVVLDPSVAALADALVKESASQGQAWDGLALLMYRTGRYDLAAKLIEPTSTPMASWLKAKLAIQKGDLSKAAEFYSQAAKSFSTTKSGLNDYNMGLLQGEQATLDLARGEYVDALDKLYAQGDTYWGDTLYVAERVLTTDELKRFVDAHQRKVGTLDPPATPYTEQGENSIPLGSVSVRLRDLLARRLVRDGRYKDALSYFHSPMDTGFNDRDVKEHVSAYAEALATAEGTGADSIRAKAWYRASMLAREWGMDMMGYEGAPDQHVSDGTYPDGYGQANPGGQYTTDDERNRFATSAPSPDLRFHYRFVAVAHMLQAAALVPPRGQAYAAMLCTAARWMYETPGADSRAIDIYQQYIRHGALVPFGKYFGGDSCPDPDFNETAADVAKKAHAQTEAWIASQKAAGHPVNRLTAYQRLAGKVRRHRGLAISVVLAFVVVLAGVGAGAWWWRKKRRQPV